MLFWVDREFLVQLFVDAGISREKSEIILRHFTLRKTAKDLLDTPLIPNGEDFVFAPTITAMIEPAFSLESLLKNIKDAPNHELSVIGPGLELNIKNDVRKAGYKAEKVVHKDYDCDVAFVIDSTLFLCECKGKYQATDFKAYSQLEEYLTGQAVTQHRRTCEYFENNLQHIRQKLQLHPLWKPHRVVRLIVTSAKLGRSIRKDDFLILDENMFHAYFTRRSPQIVSGDIRQILPDERLSGAISTDNFLDYIMQPSVLTLFDRFKKPREITLEFGSQAVLFADVECYGESVAGENVDGEFRPISIRKTKGVVDIRELFSD